MYLATKKIGKNNPKEAEIRADNATRQEWNRTVDVALVEGVSEEDILKVKQEEITAKTVQSIRTHGWLPDMFRQIIRGAKDLLQEMIFKFKLPPKPVPKIDLQEWNDMWILMDKLQKQAQGITEQLKADNAWEWGGRMNNIQACAREIVNRELIYQQ